MQQVDLLVINATQLVTCASNKKAKRGASMRDIGIIETGALAIDKGVLVGVGETAAIRAEYSAEEVIDARGKAIIPGLVDCHTHVPYAGNRYDEFEMRVQGRSYMDIMKAGGGIMSTVRKTREATLDDLVGLGKSRLQAMLRLGTTTAELKTGYGLSTVAEAKLMQTICTLAEHQAVRIVPTYLGAHTIPPEFNTGEDYLESIFADSLPAAKAICAQHNSPFFVDIFVEAGVFTLEHMQRYFEVAKQQGIALKAHLDQFEHLGAVPIAVELGATSVDHLEVTPIDDLTILAQSNTVGVMLPSVNFNLGIAKFGNARHLIDAGGILALATDYNPGSSPNISLPLVMAIACRFQKLSPAEALNACTINAAVALQLERQAGSLEVGKLADFVVLDTSDYRAMVVEFGRNFVEAVYIGGELIWKQLS
ncbi:MAG: imidazolonepropionase [Phototrophicaceae bacterium]